MTTYFITRHQGAVDWAKGQGIKATRLTHLDPDTIHNGDTVIGTLPVHIAAEVCARGARYLHLTMSIPQNMRGLELTAEQMADCGVEIREFTVREALNV